MPALRTRDTHPAGRSLEVSTALPPPSLTIISPTPRAFTFPIAHNLADSPYSSPSNSPFEPDLRALALSSSSPSHSPSSSQTQSPASSIHSQSHDECRTPPPPLPLSAFTRTLSPASAPNSPPPAAPRRKSSTGGSVVGQEERRPKKGDEDYVKRPENAFILFRRKCCEDRALGLSLPSASPSSSVPSLSAPSSAPSSMASGPSSADSPALAGNVPGAKKQRQADLSKTISQQWKALAPAERAKWEALAKEKKREHETLHPNYVYRPQRSSAKNRTSSNPSSAAASSSQPRRKHSAPPPQPQVEFVVPAPRPRGGAGRSSSAPTPPPYQAIQIPNVYFGGAASSSGAPSFATFPSDSFSSQNFSADANANAFADANSSFVDANGFTSNGGGSPTSLMPMISRRGGSGGFDYMPSFAGAYDTFEQSLQSSDFLRAMFPPQPTSISPTALSTSPGGSGAIMSPASSTSGSGPSSPYTPASASFHPSAFTNSNSNSNSTSHASHNSHPTATSSSQATNGNGFAADAAYPAPTSDSYPASSSSDMGLGLGLGLGLEADYTSYASAWAASSPWGASMGALGGGMGMGLGGMEGGVGGLAEGDFDIGRIPEVGLWDVGCGATSSSNSTFPSGDAGGYEGEQGEGGYEFGGEGDGYQGEEGEEQMGSDEFGGQLGYPSEMDLDLGMGGGMGMEMGMEMGEMGFDEMMAGGGF